MYPLIWASLVVQMAKNLPAMQGELGSILGEGNGNPLVFLPGESQGQGSLIGCRLWGHTESDTTEVT